MLKEIVNKWNEGYRQNRNSIPGVNILENELYSIAGIERSEPSSFLLIPTDSDGLQHVGSVCGAVGNRVFSKSLVSFLINRGVNEFLGIIYDPEADDTCQEPPVNMLRR